MENLSPSPKSGESEAIVELQERVYLISRRSFIFLMAALAAAAGWGAAFLWSSYRTATEPAWPAKERAPIEAARAAPKSRAAAPAGQNFWNSILSRLNELRGTKRPAQAKTGPPAISFYHWRTVYQPGATALARLSETGAERLYIRFFEVTTDIYGQPRPQATIVFKERPTRPVVPVIYIEPSVFRGYDFEQKPDNETKTEDLAAKIFERVKEIAAGNEITLAGELHLDCDWTPSTKARFFSLVQELKKRLPADWLLAVTLRLDQFKNFEATGAPPADKGVLMAYNMGDLRTPGPRNSIIDPEVAARYLKTDRAYPLPLDTALPLFSWVAVFDGQDNFQGLLRTVPPELSDYCREEAPSLFRAERPFTVAEGATIQAGWRLRLEESRLPDLLAVAGLLAQAVPDSRRLIFYHLDDQILESRPAEDLRRIARQGR